MKYYITILIFFACTGYAFASDSVFFESEKILLDMINQARQNPLAAIESLGYTKDEVLHNFPELADAFLNGMMPLDLNPILTETAAIHAADMISSQYYSSESSDGSSAEERILKKGYEYSSCGESMGMVAFNNFMKPGDAALLIYESMVHEELNPASGKTKNILNPDFREIGISMQSGRFSMSGNLRNVYLCVADFAAKKFANVDIANIVDKERLSFELQNFINAVRNEPHLLFRLSDEYSNTNLDTGGYPPVARNEKLQIAAEKHNNDMLTNLYYDSVSPDGSDALHRVLAENYEAVQVNERLGVAVLNSFPEPSQAVFQIFEDIVRGDIGKSTEDSIFNPELSEVGISVEAGVIDLDAGKQVIVFLLVADFAEPVNKKNYVVGNVCESATGTGIEGTHVFLKHIVQTENFPDPVFAGMAETGPAGYYQMEIPKDVFVFYGLTVENSDAEYLLVSQNRNILKNIILTEDR